MKKIYSLIILTVLLGVCLFLTAPAAAADETAEMSSGGAYEFPTIPPSIWLYGGMRYVDSDHTNNAEEYDYLHNSIVLGGEARLFSFPHRFHLDLDVKNKKDYFADVSYAYEDRVLFRAINRTLYHNISTAPLINMDPSTASPGVDFRDSSSDYGLKFGLTNVFLRFKKHEFPFHVYVDGTFLTRDGHLQQRSLSGSGWFNNIVRSSERRNVDQDTTNVIVGLNSHVGPVEIDISHGEKRFNSGPDSVLYDAYGDSPTRAAGVYPHNLVPDLKSSTDTLKIHTSFTGSLVASATLSRTAKENEDSDAKVDCLLGALEMTWTESPSLAVFLKYHHRENNPDSPDSVTITDATNASNSYRYVVDSAISSISDKVSTGIRYRPLRGMTVRLDYAYEDIRRDNASQWSIPDSTQKNVASVTADLRIIRSVRAKARYTRRFTIDPTYNTDPQVSDEGALSVTWQPIRSLVALASYTLVKEKRDNLVFVDTTAARRDVTKDRFLGTLNYALAEGLSANAAFAYIHNRTAQDIEYHDLTGAPQTDSSVPSKNKAHSYSFSIVYEPIEAVTLQSGIAHTLSSGTFYPDDPSLVQPVSIASFSAMKTKETVFTASAEYRIEKYFSAGLSYRYSEFKDLLDNPNDDISNGKAHIIALVLSKKW